MLKPYLQSQLALSANLIYSAVPHLMTRSRESRRGTSACHRTTVIPAPPILFHGQKDINRWEQ